jgi:hypothetical protein
MWASRRQAQQERRQQEEVAGWDARALEDLGAATMLSFGGFGFAAIKSPATLAYEYLREAGPRVRSGLQDLLATASPAGRVYAAHLLERLDPAHGRRVWEWLADQPDAFATGSGCLMDQTTLRAYAREQLVRTPVEPS